MSPFRILARATETLRRPGFLRYRESFRVRLRATDYRNQTIPGSGISTANYNHRFFHTSLPCFHVDWYVPSRGYTAKWIPSLATGKSIIRQPTPRDPSVNMPETRYIAKSRVGITCPQ